MNTIINSTYENYIQFEVMFFSIDLIKNRKVNVKLFFQQNENHYPVVSSCCKFY